MTRKPILVVEDGPTHLALREDILSAQYQLVLLDVQLPGISGYEVCKQLMQDPGLLHRAGAGLYAPGQRSTL